MILFPKCRVPGLNFYNVLYVVVCFELKLAFTFRFSVVTFNGDFIVVFPSFVFFCNELSLGSTVEA